MAMGDTGGAARSPRGIVALVMAVVGALFFLVLLREDVANTDLLNRAGRPMGLVVRYVVAMAIGGGIAGWALAGLFGRRGIGGWALAALGGVLAAAAAGLLGSAVGLAPDLLRDGWQTADLIPILFGLLVVPLAIAGHGLVALAFALLVGFAHLLAARARQGR